MSISRLVIKKDKERRPRRRSSSEASYIPQVIDKLKVHPSFHTCNDLQLSELATRITKPEELLKYFDLTQDLEAEDGGTGAIIPLGDGDVDSLEVQLVLKFLSHKLDTDDIESILLQEYGPLQAYLVIGDMILEWEPYSAIVPHGKPMMDEAASCASATGGASDVRECELPSVKVELLKTKLLEIVAEHNKRYHFHPIRRSTHGFVCSIIQAMGNPQPEQLKSKLTDYLDALERSANVGIPKDFQTHAELDQYVEQNGGRLTDGDIEYLVFHYFMFHVVCRTKHQTPKKWECTEKNCKVNILKAAIKPGRWLLNKYRTVRYTFHESTIF